MIIVLIQMYDNLNLEKKSQFETKSILNKYLSDISTKLDIFLRMHEYR